MTTTIHFIRHGEVHNPAGILYARLPRFRLGDHGREQAQHAAHYLKERPIQAVFSSPMLRARQTAQIIAAPHDLKVQITQFLTEIYTPYQGKPYQFLDDMKWNLYENIPPEYETQEDVMARIKRFAQKVCKIHPNQEVVAVTHGDILLHARLWAENKPLTYHDLRGIQPYPATASINTIEFNGAKPVSFRYAEPY